ncbi:MAG: hypothetical protein ACE5JH_04500 [Acidobacteriota bacterium]
MRASGGRAGPAREAHEPAGPRCPSCGWGDLFPVDLTRQGREVWRGAYCAGVYDRGRRKFLQRSCGYAGPLADVPAAAGGAQAAG